MSKGRVTVPFVHNTAGPDIVGILKNPKGC